LGFGNTSSFTAIELEVQTFCLLRRKKKRGKTLLKKEERKKERKNVRAMGKEANCVVNFGHFN
jgi:hypothetical protein